MNRGQKRYCLECCRRREPHRAVYRDLAGVVHMVCKSCWVALDYETYLPAGRAPEAGTLRRV